MPHRVSPHPYAGRTAALAVILALSAGLGVAAAGCSGADPALVLVGGERVDASALDRDPLALLPSGPVMMGSLDTAALFHSNLGPDVGQIVTTLLPLGPESNFVASRDVSRMVGGLYAMQGADFCAVLQGNFDVDSIRRAADARTATPAGVPLVKSRYADMDLYTAGNVGFVVLTQHTVLSGNETGMRRALDRLRRTKLERSVPSWMTDLISTPGAAFVVAADVSGQGAAEVATQQMPFLTGLQKVRTVGNFQSPGLNFAGSLTYADATTATAGAASLQDVQKLTSFMNLLSALGLAGPVPQMQVAQRDNDVAFTLPVDTSYARLLLGMLADMSRRATSGSGSPSGGWAWPLLASPSR